MVWCGEEYGWAISITKSIVVRGAILLLNQDVEARDVPDFMTRSDGIRRKLFFQEKVFYCGRCRRLLLLIFLFRRAPFIKSFMKSMLTFHEESPSEQEDEEQQPPTEQNENRELQDLTDAILELHQDAETPSERNKVWQNDAAPGNQPRRRMVLRQCRETEANGRLIVRLPALRLSNNQTWWYKGGRWERQTEQQLATKTRKLLLSIL